MAVQEIRIDQSQTNNTFKRLIALLLAVFSAALLWKLRSIQQIADSLGIANDVRAGVDMFNPHHLLFGPSVRIVYSILHAFGLPVDAIAAAQVHNIAWSVIGIVSLFFIMLKYSGKYGFALLSALCLLFTHNYWQFSTQSEVYDAALGPLLVIMARIFLYPEKQLSAATFVIMSVLLWLSICYHQTGVLFLVPLWLYYYQTQAKKGLRFMALFTIVSGVIALGTYIAVYLSVAKTYSLEGFVHYCLEYAYLNPDWGTMQHFKSINEWLKIFSNQSIAFLPVYHISKIPLWLLGILYSILWGWNVTMAVKRTPHFPFRTFLLVWLAVFYLFLVWWTAGWEFFTISLLPTLLLALFMAYDISAFIYRRLVTIVPVREPVFYSLLPGLLLVILVRYNMPSFVHYHRDHDSGYLEAIRAQELCGSCKIITNFNIMLNLSYYHNNTNNAESDGLYIAYYYKDSVPIKYQLRKDSCLLAELWYLNPWYNSLGKTGYDVPAKWMEVAENFFDIRRQNDSVNCRSFTIYPAKDGSGNYIKAGPERIQYANMEQFFYALNDSISAKGITNEAVYRNWYDKNKMMCH